MLSHKELVFLAEKWVKKKGFPIVASELKCTIREIPDVIGFSCNASILVEVKCSMSDFYADFKKPERGVSGKGVGNYRVYFAEDGVLKLDKIPTGWGLIEVDSMGKVVNENFKRGNIWHGNSGSSEDVLDYHHESNMDSERRIMYSLLRRKT